MAFIETVSDDQATGDVAEMYRNDRETYGFVPNFTRAFSSRPAVYEAWRNLNGTIKASMDLRRYELATVAAARQLQSSYCMLAHGSVLLDNFMGTDELESVVKDHHNAGLAEVDVAVMDLAEKVVDDATAVTHEDVGRLRGLGLSDADILDVVLAATARCFFSKTLDALGVQPDAKYATAIDPGLGEALTVGRPIAAA
jgi:uncharacterized peroxidase-related enzyme